MPLSEKQARSIGKQTARSLLNDCYIKASQGLDDLSLIDDITRTSTLFLKANTPWSTLKDFFNMQVGFSPQTLERINKQIDYMHETIDEATKLNIAPGEIRNQMRTLFTALRDDANMGVLEDLVDCACKYKGRSETKEALP